MRLLYELRHYDVTSDRGLRFTIERFDRHVIPLWERIGIEPVGFWTVLVGASAPRLTYLLAWEDLAQRQDLWGRFEADPDWRRTRDETNAAFGGSPIHTITNSILQQTPFSPVPRRGNQPERLAGGIFELRSYVLPDYEAYGRLLPWFGEQVLPLMTKHHIHVMGLWTPYIGVSPRLTYMAVFESMADRERAWAAYHTDPAWPSVEEGLYQGGRSLMVGVESALMRGTEFSGWR